MPDPLVSIVVPVFNGAEFLAEALDSALGQTYEATEVIVVDDGSSDDGATERVARRYGDRIRYFRQDNGGVGAALNRGIAAMRGSYFSWLSHDDLYEPDKIARQVAAARASAEPCVLFGDFDLVDAGGTLADSVRIPPDDWWRKPIWAILEGRLAGCTLLIPRRCLEEVGPFEPGLPTTQDYDLWFRLALRYPFAHLPGSVMRIRMHDGQGSRLARHLDECSLLWGTVLDRITPELMTAYEGSPLLFLLRAREAARRSPYRGAVADLDRRVVEAGGPGPSPAGTGAAPVPAAPAAAAAMPPPSPPSPSPPGHAELDAHGTAGRALPLAVTPVRAVVRYLALRRPIRNGGLCLAGLVAQALGPGRAASRLGSAVERLYRIAGLVDPAWYGAPGRSQAVIHYLTRGWREGRNPNPWFDTRWYLGQHPSLAAVGLCPLVHFALWGAREGRRPHPAVDLAWYAGRHLGQASGLAALHHLLASPGAIPAASLDHPLVAAWLQDEPSAGQVSALAVSPAILCRRPGEPLDWCEAAKPALLAGFRRALPVGRPVLLVILHDLGWGTWRYAAAVAVAIGTRATCLYAMGHEDGELLLSTTVGDRAGAVRFRLPDGIAAFAGLARQLGVVRVDVLHVAGLEQSIDALLTALAVPFDVTLLDYHLVASSDHLMDSAGRFIGDPGHEEMRSPGGRPPAFLARAERLIACSRDLAARVGRLQPGLRVIAAAPIESPRPEAFRPWAPPVRPGEELRVLLLGNLAAHKGRQEILEVARLIEAQRQPIRLHVLGALDPPTVAGQAGCGALEQHGSFRQADLTTLVCGIRPHLAWFPFQVPETYSFALSDAMLNGLPVLASAIGAAIERLEGRPLTWLLPWNSAPETWIAMLLRLREEALRTPPLWVRPAGLPAAVAFYPEAYLRPLLDDAAARPRAGDALPDDGRPYDGATPNPPAASAAS